MSERCSGYDLRVIAVSKCARHAMYPCTTMHFHSCPVCYEHKPCWMPCEIVNEWDGLPHGDIVTCDDCAEEEISA